jgi:phosphopantothenoylcysteine decarboxylase / phosphopantothenate---cysteine ligase
MHPADRIRGSEGKALDGKTVVLAICGSIAAVECVTLARELIRHGARVVPVMTPAATRILHPDAMEFATGMRPIVELTGQVEHVRYCGAPPREADVLLVAPATANTLAKMALGIDDTPVTTFATTALGSRMPVVVAPAMHEPMLESRPLKARLEDLKALGVAFVEPTMEEGKAKLASAADIVAAVSRACGPQDLAGRRALVIAGSTAEPIDSVRVITNRSSGRTGAEIARALHARGAEVTLLASEGLVERFHPPAAKVVTFGSVADIMERLKAMGDLGAFAVIVNCAAISDYTLERRDGKIPSGLEPLSLELRPAPRVLAAIRERFSGLLVGFKLEAGVDAGGLVQRARKRQAEHRLDIVVANMLEDVSAGRTHWRILDGEREVEEVEGSKAEAAERLAHLVAARLKKA